MVAPDNRRLWFVLLLVIGVLTGGRLFLAGCTELIPEEAYYWTYAQHPALGYFDHPPMVALAISAGTALFGNTELGVRFANIVAWVVTCFLLLATGKAWFTERAALAGTLLFAILPVFVGMGFLVTPDAVFVLFWTLTLLAVSRAVQGAHQLSKLSHSERSESRVKRDTVPRKPLNRQQAKLSRDCEALRCAQGDKLENADSVKLRPQCHWYWALAGLGFGGALLSKYYGLVLLPSLLIFLALSPRYRFWLKKPQPWLAGLLALAVFSPAIIWNAQHHWASFAFQSTRTVGQSGNVLWRVGTFWMYQLLMPTPIGLALLAAAAWRAVRRGWLGREDNWNFVAAFGLPVFGLFTAASFKTGIHINWTAPAFIALALGGGALWVEAMDGRRRGWVAGTWALAVICGAAAILAHIRLATGKPAWMAYAHDDGWRALAKCAKAEAARAGGSAFFIGADKYNIAAELGFYLRQPAECVNGYAWGAPGLGYRYWTDLRRYDGRPAVVVYAGKPPAILTNNFARLSAPVTLRVDAHGQEWKAMTGFGYHHEP